MTFLAGAPAANTVVTGVLGFLVVAGMGVALFFLLRSMNKQLRKVAPGPKWRQEAQDGLPGATGRPRAPGATAGGDQAPGQGASAKP